MRVVIDTRSIRQTIEPFLKHLKVFGVGFDMLIWYVIEASTREDHSSMTPLLEDHIAQVAKRNHRVDLDSITQAVHECIEDALPAAREMLENYLGEYKDNVTVEQFLGRDIILKVHVPENNENDNPDSTASEERSDTEGLQSPDAHRSAPGDATASRSRVVPMGRNGRSSRTRKPSELCGRDVG